MITQESIVAEVLARLANQRRSGSSIMAQRRAGWIAFFVQAATAKEVAHNVPDKLLGTQLAQRADNSIANAIDEYCGSTGPHKIRPLPGPPAGVYSLVSQLTILANTFQAGSLRTELSSIAGRLMQKAVQVSENVAKPNL
jgi:hypothetical protein